VERLVIQSADQVVTTTRDLAAALTARYPRAPIRWIPNSVDKELLPPKSAHPFPASPSHTSASLYQGRQLGPVLRAFRAFLNRHPRAATAGSKLRASGEIEAPQQEAIERDLLELDLAAHVDRLGRIPRTEALEILARSHLALVLAGDGDYQVPAKLYEALAIGIPTLVLAPRDSAAARAASRVGALLAEPDDVAGMTELLSQVWSEPERFASMPVHSTDHQTLAPAMSAVLSGTDMGTMPRPTSSTSREQFSPGRCPALGGGLALPSCGNSGDRSAQPVSPASPTEPVSNAADTIQLQVVRMDRGFGPALVSNAIPLPQGKLMPGNTAHVMVVVAAHELPVYVEALAGTHPDGSARAVLIQFAYAVSAGTPISALLIIGPGVTRTSDRPKTAITWGMPAAVALPKSSAYLVSTEVVGQTVPAATTPLSPRFFRAYDNQFATYADRHWATEAGQWEYDYYDRVLIWYAWWVRTGNPEYWRRGTVDAIAYRDQFIVPNHYQIQPHNAALEGLALHYLLTGDERSRDAVGQVATFFGRIWTPQLDCATCPYPEGRIQARTLTSHYLAWMINAGDSPQSWSALMATDVTKILATQRADGSYRFANWQWGHSNFETGLVHDALIKYYTYVHGRPTHSGRAEEDARLDVGDAVGRPDAVVQVPVRRDFRGRSDAGSRSQHAHRHRVRLVLCVQRRRDVSHAR